jgi:hypothetical protein
MGIWYSTSELSEAAPSIRVSTINYKRSYRARVRLLSTLSISHSLIASISQHRSISLFVEQDKDKPLIKEWLCKWRDDLTRLQSEVLDNIKAIA